MWKTVMDFMAGIFKPTSDLIDNLHTSEEEKLELKSGLTKLKNEIASKQIDLMSQQMSIEKQLLEAQSSIINAESKSESWIARNWRPITMLTFLLIIVCHSLGLIELKQEFAKSFMTLVKVGLGGYVIGRSAEKSVPAIAKAIGRH